MPQEKEDYIDGETHVFTVLFNILVIVAFYDYLDDGVLDGRMTLLGSDAQIILATLLAFTIWSNLIYIAKYREMIAASKEHRLPHVYLIGSFRSFVLRIKYAEYKGHPLINRH